jgi:hypothetical protein
MTARDPSPPARATLPRRWRGWAIDRPSHPLFVQSGGDEEGAWDIALGWPSAEEIEVAKAAGARAFPIEICAAAT